MECGGLVDEGQVQFLKLQLGVSAGLAGKGKFPVTGLVQCDKGQGGEGVVVQNYAAGLNAGVLHGVDQQFAEGVVADLAHESGLAAQHIDGGQEVGGSAAGMRCHGGIAVCVGADRREVNEQFAQSSNVKHRNTSFLSWSLN